MERARDAKERTRRGNLEVVLEPGEQACGVAVVASAMRGTRENDKCATDNAALRGVSQFPESNKVSAGSGLSVSGMCCVNRGVASFLVSGATLSQQEQ